MIQKDVLDIVIGVELGLLILAVALLFAHGAWLLIFGRRNARDLVTGRAALLSALDRLSPDSAANGAMPPAEFPEIAILRRMPKELLPKIFLEISRNVSGAGANALRDLASLVGLTDRARKMCRSRLWSRRLTGASILSQLKVQDAAIPSLLRDPEAPVRAQAVDWAASFPSADLIESMLVLLGDVETLSRFAVQDALLRMGTPVIPPLARYLESHTGLAAKAGLQVATAIPNPAVLGSAIRFSADADPELRSLAARLLGAIGGEAAGTRLVELLDDENPEVKSAAAAALGRMRHWPAASKLASLLGNSSWPVRHSAGMALRAIGGPGALLLRRAMGGDDPYAADMAELVAGLPAAAR